MNKLTTIPSKKIPLQYLGFLARYADSSKKMARCSVGHFSRFLKSARIDISQTDQNVINIYQDKLTKDGLGNGAYNTKLAYIKAFFDHMGIHHLRFKKKKVQPYARTRLISEKKFSITLKYIEGLIDSKTESKQRIHLRDFILFSIYFLTGLRKSEALNMKHLNIRLEDGAYYYTALGKGSKEIKKQFPAFLIEKIERLKLMEEKQNSDYIFTSFYGQKHNRLSANAINFNLNAYYKKATGDKGAVTVHGIRNISGLAIQEITGDILATREHFNHANINTTQIYLDNVRKMKATPYDKLNMRILKS